MKHHIVQEAYLRQWSKNGQLCLYSIPENKIMERGPNWKGFYRIDYNVLDGDTGYDYIPEKITAHIDDEGLKAIKKIDIKNQTGLDGYDKSCLAFYFALQYLRVPRRRDEFNKLANVTFNEFFKENFKSSIETDFDINKIIEEEDNHKIRDHIKNQIKGKTEEQIKKEVIDLIDNDGLILEINNVGQSKQMIKHIENISKQLFYSKWTFLISPKDTSFATSDNPCFVYSNKQMFNGILSLETKSYFPLRPDLCLVIEPVSYKNNSEVFLKISKEEVREINNLILENSYNCILTRDRSHLEKLTSRYNYSNHKKTKEVKVYKNGEYTLFNLE
ncbi:MAG: hypothetical protein RLZZ308_207 [Candidatus Parcubacteria bacterium]|jgi:hypothetical protein